MLIRAEEIASRFTKGLLQLSVAIWIIDYLPFAANGQAGEIPGGEGVNGGRPSQDLTFAGRRRPLLRFSFI